MKKKLTALLMAMCLVACLLPVGAIAADATSGTCGDSLTWTLEDGTLTISGTGEMEGYDSYEDVPWYSSREEIKTVVIESGVTKICAFAFEDCGSLTSITIPDSVAGIGSAAFFACNSLISITIPNRVTSIGFALFDSCFSLTSITLPDGVEGIGDYAFRACIRLTSITLPDGVERIGEYAFYYCSGLTSITIPDSVKSIGKGAFSGTRLSDVYYSGSEKQWSEMNIGEENERVKEAVIHYNSSDNHSVSDVFYDVPAGQWYVQYVQYVYDNGLMTGTSATTFEPNGTVTRAQVAQILYNRAGKPDAPQSQVFSDVKPGAWYYNAVQWAQSQGIVSGVGNGKFSPDTSVTREQFAVMLYNAVGKPDASGSLSSFADSAKVSSWAKTAVTWAVSNGLISGISSGGKMYLQPQGTATRAQAATMLTKYDQKF